MEAAKPEVSTLRLWILRATYALIFVGLALLIWPLIVRPPAGLERMRGVVWSMLTAVSLLAALGIRHPLKMLPVLFFELVWKVVWMVAIGLPARASGTLTGPMNETFFEVLFGIVLVPLVLPWGWVWRHYVTGPGERWRNRTARA